METQFMVKKKTEGKTQKVKHNIWIVYFPPTGFAVDYFCFLFIEFQLTFSQSGSDGFQEFPSFFFCLY